MATTARHLIVNADDLGASNAINRGIVEACEHGIVTSASLMVDMPASEPFAALGLPARELDVGLHATLTGEGGELLVAADGCRRELERQLTRFQQLLRRPPTHLDSHHNVHLEEPFLEVFQAVARERGLPLRAHSPVRYFPSFYGQWDDGETHLEQVSVASLLEMLDTEVGPGVTELGCHPGYAGDGFRSSYLDEREAELRTLCDPAIRARLEDLGIRLATFAELPEIARGHQE